jgi:hypothetical protein
VKLVFVQASEQRSSKGQSCERMCINSNSNHHHNNNNNTHNHSDDSNNADNNTTALVPAAMLIFSASLKCPAK